MNDHDSDIFTAWIALIRSQQIAVNAVERSLKEAGMPPLSWYDILLEINRASNQCLRLQEIGKRVLLAKNNVTRLIDRLEREELITRQKCSSDKRGVYASITPKGKALLDQMWPVYCKAVQQHFGHYLSAEDLHVLNALYQKMKSGLSSDSTSS